MKIKLWFIWLLPIFLLSCKNYYVIDIESIDILKQAMTKDFKILFIIMDKKDDLYLLIRSNRN